MNKLIILYIVMVITFASCRKEQILEPHKEFLTDNPKVSDMDKLVDNIFKAYASKTKTAGFSLAVIDNKQIHQYNYGETKLGNKKLPDNQTLFEIGSITKTFTANALLGWVNGKDINSPVISYLPSKLASNLALNKSPITFKNLLSHTSGFPRIPNDLPNNSDPYNGYDSTKVFGYISSHQLLRTPGTLPQNDQELANYYSNFAYGLAGILLERNLKQSLNSIFDKYIFSEFSITNTTLNNIENLSNRAYPHNSANNASYWHFTGLAGAGGIKSCLSDMIKYAHAQINAVDGSTTQRCQEPVVQINGRDYFGMGWEYYYTKTNKRITVKDGGTGGFTAFIAFEKTSKKAIVALFNNSNDNNPAEPFVNLLEEFFK